VGEGGGETQREHALTGGQWVEGDAPVGVGAEGGEAGVQGVVGGLGVHPGLHLGEGRVGRQG